MHYAVLVIIKSAEDVDKAVADSLAPYGDGREWDWYQIGGRWTGLFSGGDYDPQTDPANLDPHGKLQWPTQWVKYEGDIITMTRLTEEQYKKFYAICSQDYGWFASERFVYKPWSESKTVQEEMPPFEWLKEKFANCTAVVVDCHN